MNGPAPSQIHPPVEERISRNLRGHELESNDKIHAFATALIQFHLCVVGIFPHLDEHAEFGQFVDDFCLTKGRDGPSDAVESACASARASGSFAGASVAGFLLVYVSGEALMMIHAFHR